ncbi:MAG: sugar phosphate isomerase/epimerase [Clostridia bacterium]|nr:sugar phosphate isomerase/epimerase [Clostridia bacterium]
MDYSFGIDFSRKNGFFSSDKKAHLDNIKRQCDKLGVGFVQAHSPMGSPIVKNAAHKEFIEATKMSVEACGELGIPNIVVHSGYQAGLSKEETFEKNKEFFLDILHFAEKYGVNILVENFDIMVFKDVYWVDNASDLRELIDYVDHPLFHACWDAGHANLQEMPQQEGLELLGNDVYAVHIQDNLGTADHHMFPFCGNMSLDSLMNGLMKIGYKGYFTFEATNFFDSAAKRHECEADKRLLLPPLELRCEAEALLYKLGKHILTAYNCFEEI